MANIDAVDISTMATGALVEMANHALEDVIKNVLDPNTDSKAARSVSVTIKLKPMDHNRETVTYEIGVKKSLAAAQKVAGILFIGIEGEKVLAFEKDPNQVELMLNKAEEHLEGEKKDD